MDQRDRRESQRYNTFLPCSFKTEGKVAQGTVVNLSSGGVAVESTVTPAVEAEIEVNLLTHLGEIQLMARVVHDRWVPAHEKKLHGFGCEILSVPLGQAHFEELIDELGDYDQRQVG